ncbi:DUF3862 domain-containing protein [Bowmanella dokdonensis]|uniref:DUF3862 domain-containing protein n=1 Tax=Bowmanella dokdonensis TaxID=751969 RepID=A0A939DM69_9ALTE|nr:DUF3862 domain-containing protein [Bowmanella dokdonensis]MBN7824391.1 DUF3862 domain-containing protein [Bowmanella dokdonensis]
MKKLTLMMLLLTLAGCSRLSQTNYEQLEMGMNYREVMDILGEADHCEESMANEECIWGNRDGRHIQVNFVAGAAVYFNQQGL